MRDVPAPCDPAEMRRFLDSFLYAPEAFLVDRIDRLDGEAREVEARMETTRPLPLAALQRTEEGRHPPHVSAPELLLLTGNLGCLHAWFFHGCRWDEGWAGFGNRIHRADFKRLVRLGPPLDLHSRETRCRVGPRRVVLRYEFTFRQEGEVVYWGDQSAIFVRGLR
ncbi:MAG: hypothetical protein D6731_18885 [Planctomycetota bacterium]|nr:MAG: hypothetical protein D6731_18885 [Planctomycetota bacterium]